MKIVIAQMNHETNTFSQVPTPVSRLARANSPKMCGALFILSTLTQNTEPASP